MKKLLVVLLSLSRLALSEDGVQKVAATSSEPVHTLESKEVPSDVQQARLSVGPSLALLNSTLGVGINMSIAFHTGIPLYVGFDTGFHRWSESQSSDSVSIDATLTSIPLLATAYYRFDIPGSTVHPFMGISLGPSINIGSAKISVSSTSESGSATKVFFEGLLRAGIDLDLASDFALSLEPKLGLLKDEFVFLPQVNAVFSF